MVMASKTLIKRPVVAVPNDLDEAAEYPKLIAQEHRKIEAIKATLNGKVEELEAKAGEEAKPHSEKIDELVEGLFVFAEGRREELTEEGKVKTVKLPTGFFGWRSTPPAVSLKNIKAVLKKLKELGLKRFIRIKEEPDKEAMLKEPEVAKSVKGVSITQYEEFFIKPLELEVEIVKKLAKKNKLGETN